MATPGLMAAMRVRQELAEQAMTVRPEPAETITSMMVIRILTTLFLMAAKEDKAGQVDTPTPDTRVARVAKAVQGLTAIACKAGQEMAEWVVRVELAEGEATEAWEVKAVVVKTADRYL